MGRIAQLVLHKLRLHELFACPREIQINGAWPYFRFRKNRNFRKEQTRYTTARACATETSDIALNIDFNCPIFLFFFLSSILYLSLSRVFLSFPFPPLSLPPPPSFLNHRLSSITLHFGWRKRRERPLLERGLLRASVGKLRSIRLGNKELQAASRAARHKDIRLFRKCGSSGHTGELVPSSPHRSGSKISGRNAF